MQQNSTLTIEYQLGFAFTPGLTGDLNMSIDEKLGSDSPFQHPVVRFFTWSGPTISVGRNQDPPKRLNIDLCREHGIEIVKRPTGGKELLHGNDLCYSVVWPVSADGAAIAAAGIFEKINKALVASLADFGIKGESRRSGGNGNRSLGPCFAQVDRGEITVGGKKLIASAQRIYPKAVLQQGSMPLQSPEFDLSCYLIRFNREQIRRRIAANTTFFFGHASETLSLSSIVETFKRRFLLSFGQGSNWLDAGKYLIDGLELKIAE